MGAGNASKGDSGQVSGNEAFYTKQQKQLQKKTMNTDQKVGTYGDTKTSSIRFSSCLISFGFLLKILLNISILFS